MEKRHNELKETCQSFLLKTDDWGDSLVSKVPPCKYEDLGSVPGTHVQGQAWLCILVTPVLERQVHPCDSLISQSGQTGQPQVQVKEPVSKRTGGVVACEEQHLRLPLGLLMYVCTRTCTHIHKSDPSIDS